MEILVHAPLWVWPLLGFVILLGVLQMRERSYSRSRVLALPVVMIGLSIAGTLSSFGARADAFGAWVLAALLAVGANSVLFNWPRGVTQDAASESYRVAGSAVPLLLILMIFAIRFATGATLAIAPQRAADPAFVAIVCGLLGLCSGLFLARALRILATPGERMAGGIKPGIEPA